MRGGSRGCVTRALEVIDRNAARSQAHRGRPRHARAITGKLHMDVGRSLAPRHRRGGARGGAPRRALEGGAPPLFTAPAPRSSGWHPNPSATGLLEPPVERRQVHAAGRNRPVRIEEQERLARRHRGRYRPRASSAPDFLPFVFHRPFPAGGPERHARPRRAGPRDRQAVGGVDGRYVEARSAGLGHGATFRAVLPRPSLMDDVPDLPRPGRPSVSPAVASWLWMTTRASSWRNSSSMPARTCEQPIRRRWPSMKSGARPRMLCTSG